jgi:uncharacterized membrane protein
VQSVAIVLVLISSAMHAGWNAVGKHKVPTAAFFLVASIGGLILLAFAPLTWPQIVVGYDQRDFLLVVTAGFFEAIYLAALAGGYRSGDLSLVYPLARALPAVTVTAGSVFLGRADEISSLCWAGGILIVIGCVFLPQRQFRDLKFANYRRKAFGFAMLAALGTTGYSIIDDQALAFLRSDHPDVHPVAVTLVYSFFQVLATSAWLSLLVFSRARGRSSFSSSVRDWRHVLPTGAFITITYAVVLVALAFARDVSYVVAFRQASIPMGVGCTVFQGSDADPKAFGDDDSRDRIDFGRVRLGGRGCKQDSLVKTVQTFR